MYARFHEMSEMVIIAANVSAVILLIAIMCRGGVTLVNIKLELEAAGEECEGEGEKGRRGYISINNGHEIKQGGPFVVVGATQFRG